MFRRRLAATAALLACALFPLGVGATADELSDAQDDQEAAQQEQEELTASLEGVSAELGQAYLALQQAEADLQVAENDLSAAEVELAAKEREQQLAADRLAVAEADQEALNQELAESTEVVNENSAEVANLVVATYEGDNSLTTMTYVFSSASVEDLSIRASSMEIASSVQESVLRKAEEERVQDANRKARQDAVAERITTLKAMADQAEAEAEEARDAAASKRDEVAELTAQQEAAVEEYESEKAGLEDQLEQAEKDEEDAAAIIAEINAQNGTTYSSGSSSDLGSGTIVHPIEGTLTVSSSYGYRIHPITGVRTLHSGVDLVAACGTPQYAGISGTVTINQNSSCGNGIYINGGVVNGTSIVLAYCHLSSYSVSNGQYVSQGDQIGLTGMTGGATGCHVHFGVYLNGSTIDPMTLSGF